MKKNDRFRHYLRGIEDFSTERVHWTFHKSVEALWDFLKERKERTGEGQGRTESWDVKVQSFKTTRVMYSHSRKKGSAPYIFQVFGPP